MKIGTGVYLQKLQDHKAFYCSELSVLEIQDFVIPENLIQNVDTIYKQYSNLLEDFKGQITLHGPYMDLNPISMDRDVRKITYNRYVEAVLTAKKFSARWVVIHTYFSQIHNQSPEYQDYWVKENLNFFKELVPVLEQEGIGIVLENVFDVNPYVLCKLIDQIESKYIKVCIDVGHCNVFSDYKPEKWIEVVGDRLKYLHVSDNNGLKDSHLGIGKGNIDFNNIAKELENIDSSDLIVISEAFCSPKEELTGLKKVF
jgi:sugar phosphate isomerase/epimerase